MVWMLYVVVVSMVLGFAALAAEHAARQRQLATRWVWLSAMAASLLLPVVVSSVPLRLPDIFNQAVSQELTAARGAAMVRVSTVLVDLSEAESVALGKDSGVVLRRLWLASSVALLGTLVLSRVRVSRRMRQWRTATLCGTAVHVALDVGPAAVGLLRPRIVVPEWLTQSPPGQQALVLAHERSHLAARDPQWLAAALCLLVAMPWNLPLWWLLRRLRRAIEVDCDARVLRGQASPIAYCETLLAVGQRQSGVLSVATAMSEPVSFLEQRIRIMLNKPAKTGRMPAVSLAGVSLALVVTAAMAIPPNAAAAFAGTAQHVALAPQVIEGYLGYYQSAEQEVVHLTRDGERLFLQFTGRPAREVWVTSDTGLSAANGSPVATVLRDAQGQARELVMHRRSLSFSAVRISEAQARKVADAVAAKIRSQVATPGTEAALRRLFAQVTADPPQLEGMSPLMAAGIKEQNDQLRPIFLKLGAVRSLEFVGVTETGADQYTMRCAHGSMTWRIAIDSDGSISRVTFDLPS